jgi:hypothetical protein
MAENDPSFTNATHIFISGTWEGPRPMAITPPHGLRVAPCAPVQRHRHLPWPAVATTQHVGKAASRGSSPCLCAALRSGVARDFGPASRALADASARLQGTLALPVPLRHVTPASEQEVPAVKQLTRQCEVWGPSTGWAQELGFLAHADGQLLPAKTLLAPSPLEHIPLAPNPLCLSIKNLRTCLHPIIAIARWQDESARHLHLDPYLVGCPKFG